MVDPSKAKSGGVTGGVPASGAADIAAFLKTAAAVGRPKVAGERGRLIFALDATMSRQPMWDMACGIQGQMFTEAAKVGSLDIQLVFFRGVGECRASGWVAEAERLAALMQKIHCVGGQTQIGRVLSHAAEEASDKRIHALVYVGDAMEESLDDLCGKAGRLALANVPVFLFQEGGDPVAEQAYREIARITRGAYARFDPGAAAQLAELLRAVAIFASGGRAALTDASAKGARGAQLLLGQMK
ncbi:MAG: VWA domain-containing protein [Rhizobiales bacterium]|nr:VWA domain-containing protein [Hyphomicrobiales bacterium]